MHEYEHAYIAIDAAIFTISESKLKIMLKRREKEPFKGSYELYGGLIKKEESAEDALKRKLKEVLKKKEVFFTQFKTFTNPKRDPRGRAVSIAYLALIREDEMPNEGWHAINELPKLGFDHKEIIEEACEYLKKNLNSTIVKQFLPGKFPLNKLQEVHEIIARERFDNRNFRKKMISAGIVKETKEKESDVSHRPATLYMFSA